MAISLSFANYNNYSISESRAEKLLEHDRQFATKLTLWDKIKDFFRTEKKQEALNELFTLLNDKEGEKSAHEKIIAFQKLQSLALLPYQNCFSQKLVDSEMLFSINQQSIGSCPLHDLMYLDTNIPIELITAKEELLFIAMLNTLHTHKVLHSEANTDEIRQVISDKHGEDIYALYRPDEDLYAEGEVEFRADILSDDEADWLEDLNSYEFLGNQHFIRVGYQEINDSVFFTMIHPSISYLLDIYEIDENQLLTDSNKNKNLLSRLNKDYQHYLSNKIYFDSLLEKIYRNHGNTLNTSTSDGDSNKLVIPPAKTISMTREYSEV